MKPRPLVLFFNPNSGRYTHAQVANVEKTITETLGFCNAVSDITALRNIRDSHIFVAGGDGTFHMAINNSDLRSNTYTVIPLGSGNDFVTNFESSDMDEVLSNVAMKKIQQVDLIMVNQVLAHNVVGLGFDAYIAKRANYSWIKWASLKYVIPVIQHLFFYRPRKFELQTEGYQYQGKLFLLSMGNGKRAGGGFRLFPDAEINDGKMDLLLIKPPGVLQKLRYVWLVNFGKHTHLKIVHYQQVEKVEIRSDRELIFEADGDIYKARKIVAKCLPGMLQVIQ